MPKFESNTEFVERIMNFGCPTGALVQIFILSAIEKYADAVIAAPLIEHGLLDGAAWKRTAEWIKKEIEGRSEPREEEPGTTVDDDDVAEWVGLHYGHNFDAMSAEQKAVWRKRYFMEDEA